MLKIEVRIPEDYLDIRPQVFITGDRDDFITLIGDTADALQMTGIEHDIEVEVEGKNYGILHGQMYTTED